MSKLNLEGKGLLGIDYGTKVTGTAIYHPNTYPHPLPHKKIIYKNDEQVIDEIVFITKTEDIQLIILGIPHLTDGTDTDATRKIQQFGNNLQTKLTEVVVLFQDETLTTFEAKDRMKNSPQYNFKVNLKEIDCLCASIILEDFLTTQKNDLAKL